MALHFRLKKFVKNGAVPFLLRWHNQAKSTYSMYLFAPTRADLHMNSVARNPDVDSEVRIEK